jgi:hypothetical protein
MRSHTFNGSGVLAHLHSNSHFPGHSSSIGFGLSKDFMSKQLAHFTCSIVLRYKQKLEAVAAMPIGKVIFFLLKMQELVCKQMRINFRQHINKLNCFIHF